MRFEDALARWYPPETASRTAGSYARYEDHFRGSERAILGRREELGDLLARLLDRNPGRRPGSWLDVGSGRGLLLDLVGEAGIAAFGIEPDPALARESIGRGHQVFCGPMFEVLETLADTDVRFDAFSLLHLVEHLAYPEAEQLLSVIPKIAAPGALCVLITPNFRDLRVHGSFFRDPTHVRPYPLELVEYLLRGHDFEILERQTFDRFSGDPEAGPGDSGLAESVRRSRTLLRRARKRLGS